ncbi:hypothetical protein FQN57_005743 [Myotisia sp. PD_48]|nr:hypothetical protein FQN57_005743 [Myotisia sp. PD_48]
MPPTVVIPPGGTWFDTLKRSFDDVPIDDANDNLISTTEFLEAAEALTTLFGNDLLGNVKKIRDRQLAAPADSETLQALVTNELKSGKPVASGGLVWLVRGLDFTAQSLRQNLSAPSEELSASFRAAYSCTLKEHHNFMVKPLFSAAMSATPYRKDFYARLGEDQAKIQAAMEKEVAALEKVVAILKEFLKRMDVKG